MKKNIVVFALIMFTLGSLATYSAPSAMADWLIDSSGTLVKINPMVLGDSDNSGSGKDDSRVDDDANDDSDDDATETPMPTSTATTSPTSSPESGKRSEAQKQQREIEKKKKELDKEQVKRAREELKKQSEARKELLKKSGKSNEFKIRSEDGKIKVENELRDAGGKLLEKSEIEIDDDKERLGVMGEDGKIMEIREVGKDRLEIMKERIKTKSELELKLDEKNEISVTLPNGKVREVKLPDEALAKLVANGVITPTEGDEGAYVLTAGKNGEPVFSGVNGEVEKSVLGFKLKFRQKLDVAASDSDDGSVKAGDIVSTSSQETSPWRKFLERLAR
jgi:hypothetical protein